VFLGVKKRNSTKLTLPNSIHFSILHTKTEFKKNLKFKTFPWKF